MKRQIASVTTFFLLLCVALSPLAGIGYGAHDAVEAAGLDNCTANFHSASNTTQVQVCPTVVESGRVVYFVVHSSPNQPVTALLRYPNGQSDRQTGATDGQGLATLNVVVHYNPLYRYGQIPFLVTVGQTSLETVSGTVRVAQTTTAVAARLRVRSAASKSWCPDDHCAVKDNTSVLIRVDTDPNAQVQIALLYPNGETISCPGNDLTGGKGLFADNNGVYQCRLPVYYDLPNAHTTVTVLVQANITTSAYTIPLQYKLWLKAK